MRAWMAAAAAPITLLAASAVCAAATVSGTVRSAGGSAAAIASARVTLFTATLSEFREVRSDASGTFAISAVPDGTYRLGVSAPGRAYVEVSAVVAGGDVVQDFALGPDVHPGRWTIIGNTDPESLFATNSASLLPDGRIFLCHDTRDPVIFDPVTGQKTRPPGSPTQQGCHLPTLLADGRLLFAGGQDTNDFRDATRTAKTYDPSTGTWQPLPPMNEERWYPGAARLADGRILVMGGGQRPSAQRTPTCEIFDPLRRTWTRTGSMNRASDYPPAVLLFTGEVLRSWYPPQIYDVATGQWRDTGGFVQPDRFWPGHCDHSMVLLPDGRAMICGIYRGGLASLSMVELFDRASETWTLGANPAVTRSQPEVVLLPDGLVLCAGGRLEDPNAPVPTNGFGQTRLTDLYDPVADRWRRAADMNYFREYHATTLLVPDGRVLTTAGTGPPAAPGISNDVEAYEPPYLFRGVRPRIDSLSSTDLVHGEPFTLTVSFTEAVTSVVLLGTDAVTHWVSGAVPRLLRLPFTQAAGTVEAQVPVDPNVAPVGFYLLFAMVDDIPSVARIVRIDPSPRAGNVNAGAGPIADVLFVNGSAGDPSRRWVTLASGEPLAVTIVPPPSRRSEPTGYAFYAWRGLPTSDTRSRQRRGSIDLGDACFPTPFSGGTPQPLRISNNLGPPSVLGPSDFAAPRAPATIVERVRGLTGPIDVTLQAIIRDGASLAPEGASVSNAVIVRVR